MRPLPAGGQRDAANAPAWLPGPARRACDGHTCLQRRWQTAAERPCVLAASGASRMRVLGRCSLAIFFRVAALTRPPRTSTGPYFGVCAGRSWAVRHHDLAPAIFAGEASGASSPGSALTAGVQGWRAASFAMAQLSA